jgi:CubicO group peptidase (beta-lactamase class C family)
MKKINNLAATVFVFGRVFVAHSQTDLGTVNFGNVPVGITNTVNWTWAGGAWNGTNLQMQTAKIIGPNASEFSISPTYQGQTLFYGQDYPAYLSFIPTTVSSATATMTNYESPNPPFGSYITHLQGVGVPETPGTGPVVPELLPLQQAMTNYLVYHHFEAGTITLMHDDKLVLREGYGYRDQTYTKVIHPDNLFRLASVSKMLTASAVTKLINAGKITNTTPVYAYLGIPPWGGTLGDSRITNITVQHLLDHSGGWNHPSGGPEFNTIQISTQMGLNYPAAPTNVISWQFSKPLDFTPGTTNIYSNFGYQILGRVIEKASGKRYLDYIQQDLLGSAGVVNPIGFTNVIQARSRPHDLAPWEIWYTDWDTNLYPSAVDYPANVLARQTDGAFYFESYDSFGGLSASAIGLCNYLLNYWESSVARGPGYYGWGYTFYGSLPGATSILSQNINQTPTATNGVEFAALFNQRDGLPDDNGDADARINQAITNVTSWPTNGGGMIQWNLGTASSYKNAGPLTVNLSRSGLSTLPVKISYTTYPVTADSADYTASSGVVSIPAGLTNIPVTVNIFNNPANTTSRRFLLELLSASGGAWIGKQMTCIVNVLNTNSPPQFLGRPVAVAGGGLNVQINAATGLVMNVEVSTNLLTWQLLHPVTNLSGVISIIDPNAPRRSGSFYRLAAP